MRRRRRTRLQQILQDRGIDLLILAPGPDMAYLLNFWGHQSERPVLLCIAAESDPFIVIAAFEARALPSLDRDIEVATYGETEDPYELTKRMIDKEFKARRVAVGDHMRARFLLGLQQQLTSSEFTHASQFIRDLRMVKDEDELTTLRDAGKRADSVLDSLLQGSLQSRTEADIGRTLQRLLENVGLREPGSIVASGPNGASPHHRSSDRVIQSGEFVTLDFGGTLNGYWADMTRTLAVGEPTEEMRTVYEVVKAAQQAGVDAVRPGRTCESIDSVVRSIISEAGFGDAFIHRTGHGIGLEEHEEPYIVSGNQLDLVAGMTFSIEPGCYLPGKFGIRIEDIVAVTSEGAERFNHFPRELRIVE